MAASMVTRGLSLALCLWTADACNGDGSFCRLPFTKFTFPASHNAGSFNLNIPDIIKDDIPLVDVKDILRCFYDTHNMNYLQQLNFGMRWFWPDVCTRVSGKPDTFYDCHSSTGADESGMGWGTIFSDNLQIMKDWLSVNPRELLVVAPDNMHTKNQGIARDSLWFSHFAAKFGSCYAVDSQTQPTDLPEKLEAACIRIEGRMNENITMGDLIDRNLRVVVFPENWRQWIHSTYSEVNAGAQPEDLLQVFQDFGDGKVPLEPNTLISMQVLGAARAPDFSEVDRSKPNDPIWPVVSAINAVKKIDVRCVDAMAEKHNTHLLQDDTHPYEYFTGKDCPDSPCGCLGYQSPLEVVHQKILDLGHHIQSVNNDYSELGERQSIVQVTRRMNYANLRRFNATAEPVRTWWDCNWPTVVGVTVPLTLVFCCSCYLMLICVYPEKYGLWIRKAWERHQDAVAQKRVGREQGREDARAYLRNANGLGANDGAHDANPVMVGVTSVAPPPAVQVDNPGYYKAKETE